MPDSPLDIDKYLPGVGLIPTPVEVLCYHPKLDQEITRQVRRLDLAALFPPEPDEYLLIITHYDHGIGAADKRAAVFLWA
jgi:hypothetical protein